MTKKAIKKASLSGGRGKPGPAAKQKKKASPAAKQERARPAAAREQASTASKRGGAQRKATTATKPQGTTLPRAKQNRTSAERETKPATGQWELRLYIAGQSQKSIAALGNLKRICDEHLAGKYRIEIIDLVKQPQLAAGDQILAIPTLVRKLPSPIRKIVGDLSSTERTLVGLDVRPAASTPKGFENRE